MTDLEESQQPPRSYPALDLALVLAGNKALIVGVFAIAAVLAVVVALLIPNRYTATLRLMPPQQNKTNALAMLGNLGAISGGSVDALRLRNPSDIFVAVLKSRTIADKLIDRFDLKTLYREESMMLTRRELARRTTILVSRDGVITIDVEDQDPNRAADIANAYGDELRKLNENLAIGEAAQRRVFFEGQLVKAKNDLAAAEIELKRFSQKTGLISPEGQLSATVATAAALRAQITGKEVQLASMRVFATDSNPNVQQIQRELSGMRAELAKLEDNSRVGKGDVLVSVGSASEANLEYLRRLRDVKYNEALFEVMAKQYELARVDESRDATIIQVLDVALPPDRKSGPFRTLIVLVSVFLALLAAVLFVLGRETLRRARLDARLAGQISELQHLLSLRKRR